MEFLLLKLIHVASAIIAVGANVTYAVWMSRAHRDRAHLVFVIETIRALDRRVALPAYVVVVVTGVVMVARGAYSFTTGWIVAAIALYLVAMIVGIVAFGPTVRRQLEEARRNPASPEYAELARRNDRLTIVTLAVVAVIVVLMVTKPL
ncbi:MAG TPA: DUF2269 family protein [Candidatus Limnocylindrales bacterium]|nr:DUF2269 family protein [Candidatus Limnocylindrales bacterium]